MTRRRFRWSKWSWLWVAWFVLFFAIELPAIFNDSKNDTLTEHVHALIASSSLGWWLLAGGLVWLTAHFLGPKARKWVNSWRNR